MSVMTTRRVMTQASEDAVAQAVGEGWQLVHIARDEPVQTVDPENVAQWSTWPRYIAVFEEPTELDPAATIHEWLTQNVNTAALEDRMAALAPMRMGQAAVHGLLEQLRPVNQFDQPPLGEADWNPDQARPLTEVESQIAEDTGVDPSATPHIPDDARRETS